MNLNINQKLFTMILALFLVPLSMFAATLYIINQQKNDGLVINLAGRQRMLSQKMSKESLSYLHSIMKGLPNTETVKKQLFNTMQVFDITLNSLINSGKAPLSLNLQGKYRMLPEAEGKAATQLAKVKNLWSLYRAAIVKTLESQNEKDVQTVLRDSLVVLTEMNKAVLILQQQAENKITNLYYTQIICLALGIVIMIIFVFLNNRSLVKPIRKSVDFAQAIAEGDLSQKLLSPQTDEIGTLQNTLNSMVETLSRMISEINEKVITLAKSSTEMNTISEQMTLNSDNTATKSSTVAAASEETNSGMASIAAAMEQASTNLDTVAAATEEMSTNIEDITENVGKASENTKNAVLQAKHASDQISELGKAAEKIGEVSETIAAISDKTELLALNATIEAARAGDSGKGFAVVANEIKELSQQTADATSDISGKLKEIQNLTANTVNVIEDISGVIDQVDTTVFGINEAVEQQSYATREIAENIAQASIGVKEINTNVSQINDVTHQVAQEITEVSDGTEQMSTSSAQIQQTSAELHILSEELQKMVERFKLA